MINSARSPQVVLPNHYYMHAAVLFPSAVWFWQTSFFHPDRVNEPQRLPPHDLGRVISTISRYCQSGTHLAIDRTPVTPYGCSF